MTKLLIKFYTFILWLKSKFKIYNYFLIFYQLQCQDDQGRYYWATGDICLVAVSFISKIFASQRITEEWELKGHRVKDIFITSIHKFKNRLEYASFNSKLSNGIPQSTETRRIRKKK